MTTKFFCDVCEKELTRNYVSKRWRPTKWIRKEYGGINVAAEVVVRVGTTWNAGDLCGKCLMKVLDFGNSELR